MVARPVVTRGHFEETFRAIAGAFWAVMVCSLQVADPVHAQAPAEEQAIAAIEKLGGRVYRNTDGRADIVDLQGKPVRNEELKLLQSLPSVRLVNLDGTRITDEGLDTLEQLPNLEEVSVRRTQVSPAAATALKDRHPKVFRVTVDSKGLRLERLLILVVLIPFGICGVWLISASQRKREILPPKLYARGVGIGAFLILVSLVLSVIAVAQALGFDLNLANMFD